MRAQLCIALCLSREIGGVSHLLQYRKCVLSGIWWPIEELQLNWHTLFTLHIFYGLCVFQRVNVCMQNVCHSLSQHVERGSVSISVCVSASLLNIITSVWTCAGVGELMLHNDWRMERSWRNMTTPRCQRFSCFICFTGLKISEEYLCCKLNKVNYAVKWLF